jgi:hypothetical protein
VFEGSCYKNGLKGDNVEINNPILIQFSQIYSFNRAMMKLEKNNVAEIQSIRNSYDA